MNDNEKASDQVVENKESFKKLVRNRGTLKQKITYLEKYVNKIQFSTPDHKPSIYDVELRHKDSLNLLKDFENIQGLIESLCDENELLLHYQEREEFQERYYNCQDFLSQYLLINTPKPISMCPVVDVNEPSPSPVVSNDLLQNVLLPKIRLPTFSGNFDQWLNFKLNFTSIISNNVSLSEIQKFQFLKAS